MEDYKKMEAIKFFVPSLLVGYRRSALMQNIVICLKK